MEKQGFFKSALGIAISVAVLFGTVWIVSRAWKKGQQAGK